MKPLDNLSKTLISFAQSVRKLSSTRQFVAGAIIFFVVSFIFKGCSTSNDVEKLKLEVQSTNSYADSLKDSVNYLQKIVSDKDSKIITLKLQASEKQNTRQQLKTKQVVLEQKTIIETDTVILISLQDTTINNLKAQVAIADTIITKKDEIISEKEAQVNLLQTGIAVSNMRGDSLQTTLNTTLNKYTKKDKFFGFFPKPNRTVVAATALITGIYVGTQLTKK
jgi:hypothetical protein